MKKENALTKANDVLKWPEGWERTRIESRKPMASWKSPLKKYEDALIKELERVGVVECLITYNQMPDARLDPGVAVYFSRQREADYSWQEGLGLHTPTPSHASKFIDALLDQGSLSVKQLQVHMHAGQNTVYQTASKLGQLQLVVNNGGKYSLRSLG